jgi:hypothetical protein
LNTNGNGIHFLWNTEIMKLTSKSSAPTFVDAGQIYEMPWPMNPALNNNKLQGYKYLVSFFFKTNYLRGGGQQYCWHN